MVGIALTTLAAGTVARQHLVALGGYVLLIVAMSRSRAVLRAIDAGDLSRDGRTFALFAWMVSMVSSGLAGLALAYAALG